MFFRRCKDCGLCILEENDDVFMKLDKHKVIHVNWLKDEIIRNSIKGNPYMICNKLKRYFNTYFTDDIIREVGRRIPKIDENICFNHVIQHTGSIISMKLNQFYKIGKKINYYLEDENYYEMIRNADGEEIKTINKENNDGLTVAINQEKNSFGIMRELIKNNYV